MLSCREQADTCGEEPASVPGVVPTAPLHPETHQGKHPEIASEQFWGEGSSDAESWGAGLQSPRERGVQTHLPVLKVPRSHVIQSSKRAVLSLPELLLNSVWVIYPFSCFPEFHRMEMITSHQRGGGWKEPLHFQKCSKSHKRSGCHTDLGNIISTWHGLLWDYYLPVREGPKSN